MPKLGALVLDPIYMDPFQADDAKLLASASADLTSGADCRIIIRGAEEAIQLNPLQTRVALGDYIISVRVSEIAQKPREGQVFAELNEAGVVVARYTVVEDALRDDSTREEWVASCRLTE